MRGSFSKPPVQSPRLGAGGRWMTDAETGRRCDATVSDSPRGTPAPHRVLHSPSTERKKRTTRRA